MTPDAPRLAQGYTSARPNRALSLGVVVALHLGLLSLLAATGGVPRLREAVFTSFTLPPLPQRLPPPPLLRPALSAAAPVVAAPEIRIAAPPPSAHMTVIRAAPAARPQNHFGVATEGGLGLDVAAAAGGGAGTRGALAGFEAAVRRQVMARKHQPVLAWDRRNTCVVNYRVSVTRDGGLAGLSIDPCAVPEINEAARAAIRAAAPFPSPPGASAEVSGSLVFHP